MNKSDLQQIDELLQKGLKGFATKEDLKDFATKEDLKDFATKEDLKQFATKKDLTNQISELRQELMRDIDEAVSQIIEVVDKTKADRSDVHDLDKRVSHLEEHITS